MSAFDVANQSILSAEKIPGNMPCHCISKTTFILTEISSDTARSDKLFRSRRRKRLRLVRCVRPRRDSLDPPLWRIGRSNSRMEVNLGGGKLQLSYCHMCHLYNT